MADVLSDYERGLLVEERVDLSTKDPIVVSSEDGEEEELMDLEDFERELNEQDLSLNNKNV